MVIISLASNHLTVVSGVSRDGVVGDGNGSMSDGSEGLAVNRHGGRNADNVLTSGLDEGWMLDVDSLKLGDGLLNFDFLKSFDGARHNDAAGVDSFSGRLSSRRSGGGGKNATANLAGFSYWADRRTRPSDTDFGNTSCNITKI